MAIWLLQYFLERILLPYSVQSLKDERRWMTSRRAFIAVVLVAADRLFGACLGAVIGEQDRGVTPRRSCSTSHRRAREGRRRMCAGEPFCFPLTFSRMLRHLPYPTTYQRESFVVARIGLAADADGPGEWYDDLS